MKSIKTYALFVILIVFLVVWLTSAMLSSLSASALGIDNDSHYCHHHDDWKHDKHCPMPTRTKTPTPKPTNTPTKTATPDNIIWICCPKGVECFRGCYAVTKTPVGHKPQ